MDVKLSGRMSAVAALVTQGHRLADVGCDHGYIPIYLCLTGRIPSAVAMDINRGPLERAEKNISEFGLQDRIQTRISDGLQALKADEADTALIAGMGGFLVTRILTEGSPAAKGITELILQPQSDVAKVRRCVRELGFFIADEDMVEEDGKFYPMMKACRDRQGTDCFTDPYDSEAPEDSPGKRDSVREAGLRQETEDAFGPVLLRNRHPVLKCWLEKELSVTEAILNRLDRELSARGPGPDATAAQEPDPAGRRDACGGLRVRREELFEKERLLREALARYPSTFRDGESEAAVPDEENDYACINN